MDFLDDSLEDEILLQADDPPANAPVNVPVPVTRQRTSRLRSRARALSQLKPPYRGPGYTVSPEGGKGKPCAGNRLSQEPVDPRITTCTSRVLKKTP